MDRELVLLVLALLATGISTLSLAWLPAPAPSALTRPAWAHARRCGRRLWLPLIAATVSCAGLIGWAIREPDNSEAVPVPLLIVTALIAGVWIRALGRALHSLNAAADTVAPAVTVGLWKPRVIVASRFVEQLDESALEAVCRHEGAHVRHRDPARIWFAQLAADLQWPFPSALRRLHVYRHALELARDEEVRVSGIDGADLATAILAAVRFGGYAGSVGLTGAGGDLRSRVERLLAPLPEDAPHVRTRTVPVVLLLMLLPVASMFGAVFGESLVQGLFRWLSS